jgi:nucleotide-binding universal stress UspA family protein
MAAGDIAAALAHACDAEVVILTVVLPEDEIPSLEHERSELASSAAGMVQELTFRTRRLGVRVSERIEVGENPAAVILDALEREEYHMVVLGGVDRGTDDRPYLGRSITSVLTRSRTPALLLVSH